MSDSPLLEEGRRQEQSADLLVGQPSQRRSGRLAGLRLRGGEDEEYIVAGACGSCLCIMFLVVFMFTSAVMPNHMGIKYNSLTKHSDLTATYGPGRHWSSPTTSYILFPTTLQNVHLQMISRTNEGFPITLEVTVQYRLMQDKIVEIYKEFNIKYEQVYIRNIRDQLMKVISDYSASDFYAIRGEILTKMKKLLVQRLAKTYAEIWDIQFNDVAQSTGFEQTLLRAQLQNWFAKTKMQEQKVSAVKAHTAVIKAIFDANISNVNSTATNECAFLTSKASAQASIYLQEAEANATLLIDQAKANGTRIVQESSALAELVFQKASAEGNGLVLTEKAHADQRETQLQGLQMHYWKTIVGLSDTALVAFQKLVGDAYKQLEDVTFLFGFKNTYATADVSKPSATQAGSPSTARAIELAAITGNAAGAAAANVVPDSPPSVAAGSGSAATWGVTALPAASAPPRALAATETKSLSEELADELRVNPLKMPEWETMMELRPLEL